MDYELVLQFRGDSIDDLDATVDLEDELIEQLGEIADVDGHDVGSGETNIFIYTSNPMATFCEIKPILERKGRLNSVRAAYRHIYDEHYSVIWPENSTAKFTVA